jgi:photosystem II stability/assembly factor-like uncharacterized protein
MQSLIVVATLLLIAAGSTPALAHTATWTSRGPEGGRISSLAIDPRSPSTIYAGTEDGGVFKSSDSGDTWSSMGPVNTSVSALAIDTLTPLGLREHPGRHRGDEDDSSQGVSRHWPKFDNGRGATAIIYAGTLSSGVLKSTDGGSSWQASNSGLNTNGVRALAIDPLTPTVVYAGTGSGVFKSVDRGASWTSSGLENTEIRALVIDPDVPLTVYAGTDRGMFKSTTGGGAWTVINTGIAPPEVLGIDIRALAIDPQRPSTLYVGLGGFCCLGRSAVFKTTNAGESWSDTGLATLTVGAVAIAPDGASSDRPGRPGGPDHRRDVRDREGEVLNRHHKAETPSTVYVGSDGVNGVNGLSVGSHVFKSVDGGVTWSVVHRDPRNGLVLALGISGDSPSIIYAGTFGGGVVKSTDSGASWNAANTGLTSTLVWALAIDPATPTTLYAGAEWEIFKTADGADSWSIRSSGLPPLLNFVAVGIDAATPATVYAGLRFGGGSVSPGAFKTTDGGEAWSVYAGLPDFDLFVNDPVTPTTLYAGTSQGLRKSVDGGANWAPTGLVGLVSALAIDPKFPDILYAATGLPGVSKSTNGGANWVPVNTGLPNLTSVLALAIDPGTPTTVYLGTEHDGLFKSIDGGGSWSAANVGLTTTFIPALAVDPLNPATVYAGTNSGVFKSMDGGGTWTVINTGLTSSTRIQALVIDPILPTTVYAATLGGGVFVLRQ